MDCSIDFFGAYLRRKTKALSPYPQIMQLRRLFFFSFLFFRLGPLKSPRPNGYPAKFYQHMWEDVLEDIINIVHKFFTNQFSLSTINYTFIIFIPKKSQATSVNDFRPISHCNVVYKIISKVIANGLRLILTKIIGSFQSAFLKGIIVSDNYIIAHEVVHSFENKKKKLQVYRPKTRHG